MNATLKKFRDHLSSQKADFYVCTEETDGFTDQVNVTLGSMSFCYQEDSSFRNLEINSESNARSQVVNYFEDFCYSVGVAVDKVGLSKTFQLSDGTEIDFDEIFEAVEDYTLKDATILWVADKLERELKESEDGCIDYQTEELCTSEYMKKIQKDWDDEDLSKEIDFGTADFWIFEDSGDLLPVYNILDQVRKAFSYIHHDVRDHGFF